MKIEFSLGRAGDLMIDCEKIPAKFTPHHRKVYEINPFMKLLTKKNEQYGTHHVWCSVFQQNAAGLSYVVAGGGMDDETETSILTPWLSQCSHSKLSYTYKI